MLPRHYPWTILLLALACAALYGPHEAQAARQTLKKGIWDFNGRADFQTFREIGAGIYNTRIRWNLVAPRRPAQPRNPADPAYTWSPEFGRALAQARRHKMRVAVEVRSPPRWANGNRPPNWVPDRVEDFADFLTAATKRYPRVKYWIIWSEPTRQASFSPIIPQVAPAQRLGRARRRAPRYYARLLDAAYAAIKRVDRGDRVVGGNTFIGGDISPLNFIRALKMPSGRAPRMDLYGHNPFSARKPDLSKPNKPKGLADFSDLDTLAHWVDRYIGRDRRGKRLKLWLGELCFPTDHANRDFNVWVTRKTAASWVRAAFRIVRRWDRIETLVWIGLYDPPPAPTGDETRCGLLDSQGRPKPAFNAFKRG